MNLLLLALGLIVATLVIIPYLYRRCSDTSTPSSLEVDSGLLEDSLDYLDAYLLERGWTRDSIPSDDDLSREMRELKNIYEDGASEECLGKEGVHASVCSLVGVWKMQLGSKAMVRDMLKGRVEWTDNRLDAVRRKDALWAWTYSRYYGKERAHDLFTADLHETIMMQTIVKGLRGGTDEALERLYDAYLSENRRKYTILTCDMGALFRAAGG